jgi:hypothetical protein
MGTSKPTARLGRAAIAGLVTLTLGAQAAWAARPDCSDGNKVKRGRAANLDVVGLTSDGRLICFKQRTPDKARDIGAITGLSGDTALVGIDFRVQDGMLYGVGNAGGVYTIDTTTAVATASNPLTLPLPAGPFYGVDFNPAADRLRIVSDDGLTNFAHNVNAGGTTAENADLNYTAGVVATGINGAAYTNNDLMATTGTTLFDLDANLDQIAIQSPPGNGSLVATGKLGIDATSPVGLDIFSATVDGTTVSNHGFASFSVGGVSAFYQVDVLTGFAAFVDTFDDAVVDIAVPLATE